MLEETRLPIIDFIKYYRKSISLGWGENQKINQYRQNKAEGLMSL